MGNFEKLSVLVIGVIIVMILVVALYTWTDDPAGGEKADIVSGTGSGLVADVPKSRTGEGRDPWKDWATPRTPKTVEVVMERPDVPGPKTGEKVQDAVDELGTAKPEIGKPGLGEPLEQSGERTYTVKPSDTLGGIALSEMGSTKYWKALQERNDVDPMKLRPDTTLIIPVIDGSAVAPNKPSTVAVGGGTAKAGATYTVRNGDTIQKISRSAYRTIERWTDIWFANIERIPDPRNLLEGMTLEIPK